MSNNKELTKLEREGLLAAGLPVDTPSQLSDAFRLGMAHLQKQNDELRANINDIRASFKGALWFLACNMDITKYNKVLESTPAQSLVDIRAEAVINAANKVIRHNEHGFCIHCSLIDYANKLKGGEL